MAAPPGDERQWVAGLGDPLLLRTGAAHRLTIPPRLAFVACTVERVDGLAFAACAAPSAVPGPSFAAVGAPASLPGPAFRACRAEWLGPAADAAATPRPSGRTPA